MDFHQVHSLKYSHEIGYDDNQLYLCSKCVYVQSHPGNSDVLDLFLWYINQVSRIQKNSSKVLFRGRVHVRIGKPCLMLFLGAVTLLLLPPLPSVPTSFKLPPSALGFFALLDVAVTWNYYIHHLTSVVCQPPHYHQRLLISLDLEVWKA